MTATHRFPGGIWDEIPEPLFSVKAVSAVSDAAVPMVAFTLQIEAPARVPIRSVLLDVQIQISARQRDYDTRAQDQLLELFGTPDRWGTTLRTLPWTRHTVVVPPFSEHTTVELRVPCSYDLEVTASRYFAALRDGDVPLEFLFSGSVFFGGADGALQAARIALDNIVSFELPVSVWREAVDRHFPGSAWLRLARDTMERLSAHKARGAYPSWDAAIDALLDSPEER